MSFLSLVLFIQLNGFEAHWYGCTCQKFLLVMNLLYSTYSPVDGHLGLLQVFALAHTSAVGIYVQGVVWTCFHYCLVSNYDWNIWVLYLL